MTLGDSQGRRQKISKDMLVRVEKGFYEEYITQHHTKPSSGSKNLQQRLQKKKYGPGSDGVDLLVFGSKKII